MQALEKQTKMTETRNTASSLLREMLEARTKAADLAARFPAIESLPMPMPTRSQNGTQSSEAVPTLPEAEFPTHAMAAWLDRERLLTSAKLHVLRHTFETNAIEVRAAPPPARRPRGRENPRWLCTCLLYTSPSPRD